MGPKVSDFPTGFNSFLSEKAVGKIVTGNASLSARSQQASEVGIAPAPRASARQPKPSQAAVESGMKIFRLAEHAEVTIARNDPEKIQAPGVKQRGSGAQQSSRRRPDKQKRPAKSSSDEETDKPVEQQTRQLGAHAPSAGPQAQSVEKPAQKKQRSTDSDHVGSGGPASSGLLAPEEVSLKVANSQSRGATTTTRSASPAPKVCAKAGNNDTSEALIHGPQQDPRAKKTG